MARFIGAISHATWPEITRLASLGEIEKLTRLFRVVLLIALFTGLCYLVFIVNYGETLYLWWLNDKLPYDSTVMFLLSLQVVLTVMWSWGGNILMATNRHVGYTRWQIPVNFTALLFCYFGSQSYGLLGGVLGFFAGQCFPMLMIVPWLLSKNELNKISRSLVFFSIIALAILPASLNFLLGFSAILIVAGFAIKTYS
jgi:O-antigen/teichoic acid export membrane protein